MANRKASKGVKQLGKKSMKTTKGGGAIIQEFNPQPEPPGATSDTDSSDLVRKMSGRTN